MQNRYEAHERERYVNEYHKVSCSISKAEFCRRTGLPVAMFYSWCDRFPSQTENELSHPSGLAKVTVMDEIPKPKQQDITEKTVLRLTLPTGITVILEALTVAEMAELMKALS